MSQAFEILSEAIDEAIEDAKSTDKKLERHEIALELHTTEIKSYKDSRLDKKLLTVIYYSPV